MIYFKCGGKVGLYVLYLSGDILRALTSAEHNIVQLTTDLDTRLYTVLFVEKTGENREWVVVLFVGKVRTIVDKLTQ